MIGQFPVHMHAVSKWSIRMAYTARNLNMMDLKDSIENAFLVGRLTGTENFISDFEW